MQAHTSYKYTNDLIYEDSPYLLQHAHNPVHWVAWNEKSLQKAKQEHKLIFLSIGYSTCHWCHVMEKESFEDEKVAQILNTNYIAIKIDREEMPSVDKHFQDIYYLMNQRGGGWPLTLILTPDAKPFFSATYIPKEAKYGRFGLIELLEHFTSLQKKDAQKIENTANAIQQSLYKIKNTPIHRTMIHKNIAKNFIKGVAKNYDKNNFGIGFAPKFPHASTIRVLLNIYQINHNKDALTMADNMLMAMAKGGIYDQIESGFFRYSTDERWMIPHFEKMLYTNAELLEDYALAYKITKNKIYKKIVQNLISFLEKRFEKENLFYSASDADSFDIQTKEKEEGAYFVYEYNEAKEALIKHHIKNYEEILEYLNITPDGNFEGKNNPYIDNFTSMPKNFEQAKTILLQLREQKAYPFIDHKILTSWNALLIHSLFTASFIDKNYQKKALKSLEMLLSKVYINDTLYHQIILNKQPKIQANLEDYSFVIFALLKAYEITFEEKYLHQANNLTQKAIATFYKNDRWYSAFTPFNVQANFEGNAYVSSLAIMVQNLFQLAIFEENLSYQHLAKITLEQNGKLLSKYPANFPQATLDALIYHQGYIIIKAKKEPLLQLKEKIKTQLSYPFILYKITNDTQFLGCKVDNCFAFGKNEEEMIQQIKKTIQN
ncbi:Thymidylate kinase [hydrothermal vent metagenome]|uniref:Thymidylate kinase n=1 Tax=hydrothermal vent metagenome TaxID=652676 RepID=A0A1W1D5L9_9ZZZZ